MGTLAMGINPLSKFQGTNAATPKEGSLAYDENFHIFMAHETPKGSGNFVWTSKSKEIEQFLNNLSASGLFEASAAFVNNRKILRFYYDPDNGVVRLNPDLRFDSSYRYYAIRNITKSESGGYAYITGEANSDGNIVASLVNMDLVDAIQGDGTQMTKPATGKLYGEVIDGNAYIVEYYDINRTLIDVEPYQAVKVRTADTDLCPDTAIKDLIVHCNQEANGAIFLHQGQSVDELAIQVKLDYGDDLHKDISHEETNGGRLAIQGLDEIDTTTLTADGAEPQKIVVSYTMIRSNTSYPTSSSYSTSSGAVIAPASNTIYKEIPVNIIESENTDLVKVVPVGWIQTEAENTYNEVDGSVAGTVNVSRIKIKFFGLYSNGTFYDITNLCTILSGFSDTNVKNTQNIQVSVRLGYNQYVSNTYQFTVYPPGVTVSGNVELVSNNRVTFEQNVTNWISFDTTKNAGGVYSGAFVGFKSNANVIAPGNLLGMDEVKFGDYVPNYIRIRDAKDPSFYYTDIVQPSDSIYYKTNSEHILTKDTPIIVEFYHITIDSSTNKTINIRVTGAMNFFAENAASN
jgi:hypothetical protein